MKKILLVLVLLVGCDSVTGPTKNLSIERFMPLNEDNSWTYANDWVDYKGVHHPDTTTSILEQVFVWGSYTAYSIGVYDYGTGYRYNSDGHYLTDNAILTFWPDHPDSTTAYSIMLKEPLIVGGWWVESDIAQSGYMDTFEIVSITTSVNVPAGLFTNCIKVEEKSGTPHYYYYALDVGLVKEEIPGYSISELLEYDLK